MTKEDYAEIERKLTACKKALRRCHKQIEMDEAITCIVLAGSTTHNEQLRKDLEGIFETEF